MCSPLLVRSCIINLVAITIHLVLPGSEHGRHGGGPANIQHGGRYLLHCEEICQVCVSFNMIELVDNY